MPVDRQGGLSLAVKRPKARAVMGLSSPFGFDGGRRAARNGPSRGRQRATPMKGNNCSGKDDRAAFGRSVARALPTSAVPAGARAMGDATNRLTASTLANGCNACAGACA